MDPSWIDKLGIFLFPNADPFDRHRKTWQVIWSVIGSILLVLAVALVMIKVSGAHLNPRSGWKNPVEMLN